MLKDAEMNMHVDATPMQLNFILTIYNRKVDAEESLKTPAGTFNCVKISQSQHLKAMISMDTNSIEWYAEGVGLVRSESYNKKGKLMGYSLLTAFSE